MRDLIFRGKCIDRAADRNGEWIEGFYTKTFVGGKEIDTIHRKDISGIYVDVEYCYGVYEVNPKSVGMFTGLTDKNGEKIFEKDICKDSLGNLFAVVWDEENARFIGRCKDSSIAYVGREPKVEVIGNAHDNPELIKKI